MKTNTIYLFLISFVLFALTVGLNFYVAKQISSKIEIVKVYYAQDNKNKNLDFGSKLKKEMTNILEQEEIVKRIFLNQDEIIVFITNIETLAQKLNLEIMVDKVEKATEKKIGSSYRTQTINFNISATGTFEQIKFFMDHLAQTPKIISVKEFKIYKTGEEGDLYSARITIIGTILSI